MTKRFSHEIHGTLDSESRTVRFDHSEIMERLHIDTAAQIVIFSNSSFRDPITLQTDQQNKRFDFNGCVFEDTIDIEASNEVDFDFSHATFKKSITITGDGWLHLDFSSCKFHGEVKIGYCKLNSVVFDHSIFLNSGEDSLLFFESNEVVDASFKSVKGCKSGFFSKSVFKKSVSFDECEFSEMCVYESTEFHGDCYFNNSSFGNYALFNGASFKSSAIFVNANRTNSCDGDFSGAIFVGRAYFNYAKFKELIFKNVEFQNVSSFQYLSAEKLTLERVIFQKGGDFLNSNVKKADRETYRIIKSEFLSKNNNVEALHFRSKEMHAYEKELSFSKKPGEWFLINLNKFSNNHGLSWERGLLFTFIVSVLFYSLYLFSLADGLFNWGFTSWGNYWQTVGITLKYYIRFFIITHDLDFMSTYKPTALSFIIDFFGKVFIGYGIYQTVQSFRKHGKA